MSNWSRKNEEKEFVRRKKRATVEMMAKYFLDLSKLVFAAIVLGGFTPLFNNEYMNLNWPLILGGAFTTYLLAIIGYIILK